MSHDRLKTFVLVALPSCAVLMVLWMLQHRRETSDTRTEVRALQETRFSLEAQLQQLKEQIAISEKEQAEIQATLARINESNAATNVQTTRNAMPEKRDLWSIVMSDPILQNLYLASERAKLTERYAAVFRNLGLSAPQVERLGELILRRNEQRMDLQEVVRTNHLSDQDLAVAKLREKAAKSFHADFVGLLGEPAYQVFTHYERALPVLEMVNKLAGAVALEGHPLTEPQATLLTDTLADTCPPYRDGGTADPNKIDWPVALAESARILTEPQVISFRNMAPVYRVDNDSPVDSSP